MVKTLKATILVHGGAGFWTTNLQKGVVGVADAARSGMDVFERSGTALEAVEAAVIAMENNPIFDAGRGSFLTALGTVEMDAAIMDGKDLSAGAVALVRDVKNPIRLARVVMEKTDHVLLAGPSAEKLASAFKLPRANPVTHERHRMWTQLKKGNGMPQVKWIKRNRILLADHPQILGHGTVGAVSVDTEGNFAAASSTGGVMMKLPGRIGDTPLIGCGLYADNLAGAATATGIGEVAIRLAISKMVCSQMRAGFSASKACFAAVQEASARLRNGIGIIAIDRFGGSAAIHNTPYMPWAVTTRRMRRPKARARGRRLS
jgi:beta-aspartyl-peptidase (threonine type)